MMTINFFNCDHFMARFGPFLGQIFKISKLFLFILFFSKWKKNRQNKKIKNWVRLFYSKWKKYWHKIKIKYLLVYSSVNWSLVWKTGIYKIGSVRGFVRMWVRTYVTAYLKKCSNDFSETWHEVGAQ